MSDFLIHSDDRFRRTEKITVASSIGGVEGQCKVSESRKRSKDSQAYQADSPNKCPKPFLVPGDLTAELLLHAPHCWNSKLKGIFPRFKSLRVRGFSSHCQGIKEGAQRVGIGH